jgi:hypothetical protein
LNADKTSDRCIRAANPMELPDAAKRDSLYRYGFLSADDPSNPFHLVNFDCAGTVVVAAAGESGVVRMPANSCFCRIRAAPS